MTIHSFLSDDDHPFRSLLEAAPDGIIVSDKEGYILLANSQCEAVFGYHPNELLGKKIELLVPEAARLHHGEQREEYFTTPKRRPMGMGLDLLARHKTGKPIPVEISLSPIFFQGKDCAIAIVRDVTELRRLSRELKQNNAELKRSNEDLEHFAYVASHDLQEPLRMVGGYTQLLQRRYSDHLDEDAKEYIAFAVDGVHRMQALINDLLTYARVSTRPKSFSKIDMNVILRQVMTNLDSLIHEKKAYIETFDLPSVYGDPLQMAQLMQNLLTNAIKFHKKDGSPTVKVRAERQDSSWIFHVQDDGIGIDPQYLDRIFVLFQRLHTRDQYPGTGMGLAICKKIIERHGGKIYVTSTPNVGTTFSFTLNAEETPGAT